MRDDYLALRELLLAQDFERMETLAQRLDQLNGLVDRLGDRFADEIDSRDAQGVRASKLASSIGGLMVDSLESVVRQRPEVVVTAVYPVIGPAIRRSLTQALRQLADDADRAVRDVFSIRTLRWRMEAWRIGAPYAQVLLRHTARYRVEHLLWIEPVSGLLRSHVTAKGLPELDADAVAGMFTAINHFVRDSVAGSAQGIVFAQVGESHLAVSHGPEAWLVAFVSGVPSTDFGKRLEALNESLHARLLGLKVGEDGAAATGGEADIQLERTHLDALERSDLDAGTVSRRRGWIALVGLLVICALIVSSLLSAFHAWKMGRVEAALGAAPGLYTLAVDGDRSGRVRVRGLIDSELPDPRSALSAAFPDLRFDWQLSAYVSLSPASIQRRAVRALDLPPRMVAPPEADGRVVVTGKVSFSDWFRATRAVPPMGVARFDLTGLQYPEQEDIYKEVRAIEALQIEFQPGESRPASGDVTQWLDTLDARLQRLRVRTLPQGIGLRIVIEGFADRTGSYNLNRQLRSERADWLAEQIAARLNGVADVNIAVVDPSDRTFGQAVRRSAVTVQLLPLQAVHS